MNDMSGAKSMQGRGGIAAKLKGRKLRATYYDTPDLDLHRAGLQCVQQIFQCLSHG